MDWKLERSGVPGAQDEVVMVIDGSIASAEIPGLCDRVRGLLEGRDGDVVVCDVGALTDPDLCTVDALARLQLTVLAFGGRVRLRHASSELQELLVLVGLGELVPLGLRLEPRRQAEEGEQPGGVEEGVHGDDPTG